MFTVANRRLANIFITMLYIRAYKYCFQLLILSCYLLLMFYYSLFIYLFIQVYCPYATIWL
jgi:hypothetical protein